MMGGRPYVEVVLIFILGDLDHQDATNLETIDLTNQSDRTRRTDPMVGWAATTQPSIQRTTQRSEA